MTEPADDSTAPDGADRPASVRPARATPSDRAAREAPVLPRVSGDETEVGWGERFDDERDDERYLRERPPHHEG